MSRRGRRVDRVRALRKLRVLKAKVARHWCRRSRCGSRRWPRARAPVFS